MKIEHAENRILVKIFYGLMLSVFGGASPAWSYEKNLDNIYNPIGKRDPFKAPLPPLSRTLASLSPTERFSVDQLELRAILRSGKKNRAMFEDPEGKTHILGAGETLGRERAVISRILNAGVVVTEKSVNYLGIERLQEKVMTLPVDQDFGVTSIPRELNSEESEETPQAGANQPKIEVSPPTSQAPAPKAAETATTAEEGTASSAEERNLSSDGTSIDAPVLDAPVASTEPTKLKPFEVTP